VDSSVLPARGQPLRRRVNDGNPGATIQQAAAPGDPTGGVLAGKRLLVTGVSTTKSIAWAVARDAQLLGAEVMLTSFGRMRALTHRAASRLPLTPEIVELDVTKPADLASLAGTVERRWGRLDGAVHAIAYAPPDAMSGDFLATPPAAAIAAFEVSAISFKELASVLSPLLRRGNGETSSLVSLTFESSTAWPSYDWMGVAKAALESITRYLARDLGAQRIRVNAVSSGPILTVAAGQIPAFEEIDAVYRQRAPIGWDHSDAGPVAGAICFLLSELSRGMTGQILRVDGGCHSVGCSRPAELRTGSVAAGVEPPRAGAAVFDRTDA
jgi:meromycolic acid enoyl-[acyl-carrier protein] reductase